MELLPTFFTFLTIYVAAALLCKGIWYIVTSWNTIHPAPTGRHRRQ